MPNAAYSIIIPCLNEEHYIGKLLECLLSQTYKKFEVIVVDGQSKDKTQEIVNKFSDNSKEIPIKLVISNKRSVSHQRNLGVKNSQYDRLLFLDSDVQVKSNFLSQAIAEIDKRELQLATVKFEPLSVRVDDKLMYSLANSYISLLQYIEPVSLGWCIFSTRYVHELIKGFDESLSFGEDYNYVVRAAEQGVKLKILKKGIVYISVRRLSDEGRLNFVKKAVLSEAIRFMKGKVDKDDIPYEFGKFKEDVEAIKFSDSDSKTKDMWTKLLSVLNINGKEHS